MMMMRMRMRMRMMRRRRRRMIPMMDQYFFERPNGQYFHETR